MAITIQTNFKVNSPQAPIEYMTVADLTARDAIPSINRFDGMVVYLESDNSSFQLQGGTTNLDWASFGGSSLTFDNGLTDTAGNVQLGGLMLQETILDFDEEKDMKYETFFKGVPGTPPITPDLDEASFQISRDNNGRGLVSSYVSEPDLSAGTFLFYDKSVLRNQFFVGPNYKGFDISNSLNGFKIVDQLHLKGMLYEADYSANYTDRSIVDKAYVDSVS